MTKARKARLVLESFDEKAQLVCEHADLATSPADVRPCIQQCAVCGAIRTEDVVTLSNGRLGWEWQEWKR